MGDESTSGSMAHGMKMFVTSASLQCFALLADSDALLPFVQVLSRHSERHPLVLVLDAHLGRRVRGSVHRSLLPRRRGPLPGCRPGERRGQVEGKASRSDRLHHLCVCSPDRRSGFISSAWPPSCCHRPSPIPDRVQPLVARAPPTSPLRRPAELWKRTQIHPLERRRRPEHPPTTFRPSRPPRPLLPRSPPSTLPTLCRL